MKYRSDIDGLRAIAVIPVVLFHLGLGFPGGFTGVDVFFVISGYLISGIILKGLSAGTFSSWVFYERRTCRILPAFFSVALFSLIAGWFLFYPTELDVLAYHLSSVTLFGSNIWLSDFDAGYWAPAAEALPLLHTWSLAVEEQFYFVMPVFLMFVHKCCPKRVLPVLVSVFFVSLSLCIFKSVDSPKATFYLLPYRAWEMLLGSIVYVMLARGKRRSGASRIDNVLGLVGCAFVFGAALFIDDSYVFPGYVALLPTVGSGLIIYSSHSGLTFVGRALSIPPLQFIGKISYSLYLWHWPIIVFASTWYAPEPLKLSGKLIVLFISFVAGVLSWRFVEQPFRLKKGQRSRPYLRVACGCCVLVGLLAISLVIRKKDGFPERLPSLVGESVVTYAEKEIEQGVWGEQLKFNFADKFGSGGQQWNVVDGEYPEVVVIGDSHARMYGSVIKTLADSTGTPIAFFTQVGRKSLFDGDTSNTEVIHSYLKKWKPRAIIVINRFDNEIEQLLSDDIYADVWAREFQFLCEHCSTVYHLLPPPRPVANPISGTPQKRLLELLAILTKRGSVKLPNSIVESELSSIGRSKAQAWFESRLGDQVQLLNPAPFLMVTDHVKLMSEGRIIYYDDNHLSDVGASEVVGLFREIFNQSESNNQTK